MTNDEIRQGTLTIEGHCAVWFDRPDGGWGCDLTDLPEADQEQILMAWLNDHRTAHAAFDERQRIKRQHGGKVAFLDEERARGRQKGKRPRKGP